MSEMALFRGIRIDNSDWAYGNLVLDKDIAFITRITRERCTTDTVDLDLAADLEIHPKLKVTMMEVHQSTVGQCTGLRDGYHDLIFEGDIIRLFSNKIKGLEDKEICGYVKFGKYKDFDSECDNIGFYLDTGKIQFSLFKDLNAQMRILGNIYMNRDYIKEFQENA